MCSLILRSRSSCDHSFCSLVLRPAKVAVIGCFLSSIADIHDPFETRRRWQGKAALRTGIGRLLQLQYLKPKATRQVLGRSSPTPSVKPASLDKAEKRSSSRKNQLSRSRWSPTAEQ